jgi:peroxiredoxin
MQAWARSQGVGDEIYMVADGAADFIKSIGVDLDYTDLGFGIRGNRFFMIVNDGVIEMFEVEPHEQCTVTKADHILSLL